MSDICLKHDISLTQVWIPGDLGCVADYLSKTYDFDDHQVTEVFFRQVVTSVGVNQYVDRFASNLNNKIEIFYSAVYCPGTSGVDVFKYSWSEPSVNWLFPPMRMAGRVLNLAENFQREGPPFGAAMEKCLLFPYAPIFGALKGCFWV